MWSSPASGGFSQLAHKSNPGTLFFGRIHPKAFRNTKGPRCIFIKIRRFPPTILKFNCLTHSLFKKYSGRSAGYWSLPPVSLCISGIVPTYSMFLARFLSFLEILTFFHVLTAKNIFTQTHTCQFGNKLFRYFSVSWSSQATDT